MLVKPHPGKIFLVPERFKPQIRFVDEFWKESTLFILVDFSVCFEKPTFLWVAANQLPLYGIPNFTEKEQEHGNIKLKPQHRVVPIPPIHEHFIQSPSRHIQPILQLPRIIEKFYQKLCEFDITLPKNNYAFIFLYIKTNFRVAFASFTDGDNNYFLRKRQLLSSIGEPQYYQSSAFEKISNPIYANMFVFSGQENIPLKPKECYVDREQTQALFIKNDKFTCFLEHNLFDYDKGLFWFLNRLFRDFPDMCSSLSLGDFFLTHHLNQFLQFLNDNNWVKLKPEWALIEQLEIIAKLGLANLFVRAGGKITKYISIIKFRELSEVIDVYLLDGNKEHPLYFNPSTHSPDKTIRKLFQDEYDKSKLSVISKTITQIPRILTGKQKVMFDGVQKLAQMISGDILDQSIFTEFTKENLTFFEKGSIVTGTPELLGNPEVVVLNDKGYIMYVSFLFEEYKIAIADKIKQNKY